jgi:hypothetical protein
VTLFQVRVAYRIEFHWILASSSSGHLAPQAAAGAASARPLTFNVLYYRTGTVAVPGPALAVTVARRGGNAGATVTPQPPPAAAARAGHGGRGQTGPGTVTRSLARWDLDPGPGPAVRWPARRPAGRETRLDQPRPGRCRLCSCSSLGINPVQTERQSTLRVHRPGQALLGLLTGGSEISGPGRPVLFGRRGVWSIGTSAESAAR